MNTIGVVPTALKDKIMAEKKEDLLEYRLKTAARVGSVEEFMEATAE